MLGDIMNLKKTDKIIAVVGVIILIVAAVGIVFYTSGENEGSKQPIKKTKQYSVEWISASGKLADITGFASKKEPFTGEFTVEALEPGSVIINVDVHITWEDNIVTKFALFRKGQDTLTAVVNSSIGESKTHSATGSGNETLSFIAYSKPNDEIIEDVESETEAESVLLEKYDGMNTISFDFEVQVVVGEKLLSLRPIKLLNYLRDKGNDFTLEITYDYYYPELQEYGTSSSDSNNTNNEESYIGVQTWAPMAYSGKN